MYYVREKGIASPIKNVRRSPFSSCTNADWMPRNRKEQPVVAFKVIDNKYESTIHQP